ncbi:MCE family protein [Amycolatopsis suaedae]|uniref:MCE family protein n=1 Tax=Amycolatopsis suaedae TaxID=2510978 RepID=A0A4Q7JF44_9PSEU|nr:MCE family protein [Amycolatopsis suaedae]RZQ65816.1 MCE family protein [Amycolatopsis suaedae]
MRATRWVALAATAVVLAAAGGWALLTGGSTTVTAYFTAAVGLYPGSDVRVLGVAVGTVDAVEPEGQRVRVTMSLDPGVAVPADAGALVVTPSLVSDRYVQLAPVYETGPRLAGGAVIPESRTVVPVELDQLFTSLEKLTVALGPDGANRDGALSELLDSGAQVLGGTGRDLNRTIAELGKATRTLSGSEEDLFSTVDSLQRFTGMLAAYDQQVRTFDNLLGTVTRFLADDRDDFAAALSELAGALGTISGFINDNRARIKSNVDKLAGTTTLLAQQRESLAEALDRAPGALTGLLGAYDPERGTVDVRTNLAEFAYGQGAPALPLPSAEGGGR